MCMYRFTHDAVYLYLLTVNQTLAEGYSDYRDGHLILNKTIGQRFVGRYSTRNDSFVVLNAMAGCTMAEKFRPIIYILLVRFNIYCRSIQQKTGNSVEPEKLVSAFYASSLMESIAYRHITHNSRAQVVLNGYKMIWKFPVYNLVTRTLIKILSKIIAVKEGTVNLVTSFCKVA